MKQGRSIAELAQELERQRTARKDFLADTRKLRVETLGGNSDVILDMGNDREKFRITELAHRQIADRLQIPFRYYTKMRNEYPDLLDYNINSWFQERPEKRMLRTLDGNARAFLSGRYRRLDNLELAYAVFPVINEMKGAEVVSCQVTDNHMFIKVINKRLKAEVALNDVVQAGMVISNSEVGLGSLKVEPLIYRLVCKNGLIVKDYAQKKYHVGRQIEKEDSAYEIYSDETLEQDDRAFFMKVQDTVRTAVDEAKFQLSVNKLRQSKEVYTGDNPVDTIEVLADRYILNEAEKGGILRHFLIGGDISQYGLINAVTRASQDIDDYTRATDLERIGGDILASVVKDNKLRLPIRNALEENDKVIDISR